MSGTVLAGGRVIDPATALDAVASIRFEDGVVTHIDTRLAPPAGDEIVDVTGLVVTPGLVDLHVHLREPGGERKETIATGAAAAAAGGFTTICAMPNTDPVTDTDERVRTIVDRGRAAAGARVRPIAAASLGSRGETPTDVVRLAAAGAVAVSDDGSPIATAALLAEVLARAADAGIVVADHCEDLSRSAGGAMLAGEIAERLGVVGIPPEAESDAVGRDLEVLAETGGRLHLCHLSTARSVDRLRDAKAAGLPVTAEVCPHHLALTVECVPAMGTAAKMNPPLARSADREALIAALADGTIDAIATDHAPHTTTEKQRSFPEAPFGVIGLETAFGVLNTSMVETGQLGLPTLVERLTVGPARAFGLRAGRIAVGEPADLSIFDPAAEWVVDPERFRSRARNTPWAGRRLKGRPVMTWVAGRVVFDGR